MAALTLSENARRVLETRYLRRDAERRVIETPEQLFARVARAVAEAEESWGGAVRREQKAEGRGQGTEAREGGRQFWEERFHEMLVALEFLPNSPALMNAGTPLGQLAACFVLPVEDTLAEIFEALKEMALIQRTGGGTGFSFSRLRPKADVVASTGGESSGPVSFMKIFDCATEHVKQGGRRRGANMGVLRVDHPDLLEFIGAKLDEKTLQNFNISVGVTDAFMQALREQGQYELVHPTTKQSVRRVPAREVFDAIVAAAWGTGDPGLLFLDNINRANPTPQLGAIEATNPCGEIPLLPYESCNLGSINLARMVRRDAGSVEGGAWSVERGAGHPGIDWERLRHTVKAGVRFLDNIIEVNKYPVPAIQTMTQGNRKIGLGVMGFAEMLIELGISYDSDAAVGVAEEVMRFIAAESLQESRRLAEERGVFPNWRGSVYEGRGLRVRNATCNAIAPTGTIGIIANTSPSIEPLFALAYRRSHVLGSQTLPEVTPIFLEYLQRHHLNATEIVEQILEKGRLQEVSGASDELKRLFATALEIPAERHLQIQAAFQRHVDNSVSKTINLPHSATPQDIAQVYQRAWELGLKGITIYRYGSKTTQVMELGVDEKAHHYDHASRCDPEECRV